MTKLDLNPSIYTPNPFLRVSFHRPLHRKNKKKRKEKRGCDRISQIKYEKTEEGEQGMKERNCLGHGHSTPSHHQQNRA